jgi:hypothetical protein
VMRRPGTASPRGQLSDDAGVLWRGPQRSEDTLPHRPRIPPGRRPRLTEYGNSSPALNRCLVGVYSPVSGYMSRVRCCTLAGIAGSRRRGEWIDPAPSKIFVGEWLRWHGQQVQLKPSTLVRVRRGDPLSDPAGVGGGAAFAGAHSDVRSRPASVRYAHRLLSLALATAVKDCRMVRKPRRGCALPGVVRRNKRFLTHEHVEQLAEACVRIRR